MLYSLHHSGGIHNSARVCITGIVAQIDGLGIPRPKKNCTLQELLIYFGNRLVEEKLVQIKNRLDCVKRM